MLLLCYSWDKFIQDNENICEDRRGLLDAADTWASVFNLWFGKRWIWAEECGFEVTNSLLKIPLKVSSKALVLICYWYFLTLNSTKRSGSRPTWWFSHWPTLLYHSSCLRPSLIILYCSGFRIGFVTVQTENIWIYSIFPFKNSKIAAKMRR